MKLVLSPAAKRDLKEISVYTLKQWGIEQADRYTYQLENALKTAAENPYLGAAFTDIRHGYRKIIVETHRVYYRVENDSVTIIRILHQSRDSGPLIQ
jgi:toxin ParE1/3/4